MEKIIIGVNALPLTSDGGGMKQHFIDTFINIIKLQRFDRYRFIIFYLENSIKVINEIIGLEEEIEKGNIKLIKVDNLDEIWKFKSEFNFYLSPLNSFVPKITDMPSISILADIQEQYFPQFFSKADLLARNIIYPDMVKSSHCLVTISEFSKSTMVEKFGVEPSKISIVYPSLSSKYVAISKESKEPTTKLPEKYLIYPANSYPHKNHNNLLKALKILKEKGRTDYKVVLSGNTKYNGNDVSKQAAELGVTDMIVDVGFTDYLELNAIFKKSQGLIFPSLFEGFGIPVIEFCHINKPILCSDDPCLNEIAGAAIHKFDRENPESIANTIIDFIDNKLPDLSEERKKVDLKFNSNLNALGLLENIDLTYYKFHSEGNIKDQKINFIVLSSKPNDKRIEYTVDSIKKHMPNATIQISTDSGKTKLKKLFSENPNSILLIAGTLLLNNFRTANFDTYYAPYIRSNGFVQYIPSDELKTRFIDSSLIAQNMFVHNAENVKFIYEPSKTLFEINLEDYLEFVDGKFTRDMVAGRGFSYKVYKYLTRRNLGQFVDIFELGFNVLFRILGR